MLPIPTMSQDALRLEVALDHLQTTLDQLRDHCREHTLVSADELLVLADDLLTQARNAHKRTQILAECVEYACNV